MESSDQVTYDAVTVTAQLRALAGGAAYWTADETTAWVAELLEKYQAHLSRRMLFIDRLKQEVRAHSYVPLIRGCLVRRNQQLGGRSRPRGESCRVHRARQASCVRGSPTPVHRDPLLRPSNAPMDTSLTNTTASRPGDVVSPRSDEARASAKQRASEDAWSSNVVRCYYTDC